MLPPCGGILGRAEIVEEPGTAGRDERGEVDETVDQLGRALRGQRGRATARAVCHEHDTAIAAYPPQRVTDGIGAVVHRHAGEL